MTDRQQLEFNFSRGAKLRILNMVAPLMPYSRMARVLRAIDELTWQTVRDEHKAAITHRQIGDYDGMSVPTVRRGIEDLVDHQLIIKDPVLNSHGQQANSYQIVWSNLNAIANGEPFEDPAPVPDETTVEDTTTPAPDLDGESTQVVKVAGDHSDYPPDHHDQPPDHYDQPPPDHCDQASLCAQFINPPPSNKALVVISPEWLAVENKLRSMGVGLASDAIEKAQGRGCSPDDVLQLIQYARSKDGAFGPGAIKNRVCEQLPGNDPTQGWPPESEKYLKKIRRAEAQKKGKQAAQNTADRQEKRKANKHAQQELEHEYGAQLDRLNRDELLDFVTAHCKPLIVRAIANDPDVYRSPGFYRVTLLEALKDQAKGLPGESQSAVADGMASADRK